MVFEPQQPVSGPSEKGSDVASPPVMFDRPADPPHPVAVTQSGTVQGFRRELSAQLQMRRSRRLGSLRATVRAWAGRVSGRADRRLLFSLAEVTNALLEHCDSLVEHISRDETLAEHVIASFGEDLTHLRAEVNGLRRSISSQEEPRGG